MRATPDGTMISARKDGSGYRIGQRGQRAVAHVQADIDRRRAERRARVAIVMAQRLAEIQAAEARRQNKRGR